MKIYEAITIFIVDKMNSITPAQWNKLMFFTDSIGACQNKQFTKFTYVKLPFGPVPDDYSDLILTMGAKGIIKRIKSIDNRIKLEQSSTHKKQITEANKILNRKKALNEAISKIVELFKNWSATRLSDFSQELDAWKKPEMYSIINLKSLKKDSFLEKEFGEPNLEKLIFS